MMRRAVRLAAIQMVLGATIPACGGSTQNVPASGGAAGLAGAPGADASGGAGGATADSGAPADSGPDVEAGQPQACDAMQPASWSGETPWGTLDATVERFGAGDCITTSQATVTLGTAAGDALLVDFPYPVEATTAGRVVKGSFDEQANVSWQPVSGGKQSATAAVHVAVNVWAEHGGDPQGHEIDATLTFTDPAFGSAPISLVGRFCRWDHLVC